MKFYKNGMIEIDSQKYNYLVNNFSESGNTNGWSLGGTYSNGIVTLVGTGPAMTSPSFTVAPDDIVAVEFDLEMTSPSSSGDGLYFGTEINSDTINYRFSNDKWDGGTDNSSMSWNTYLLLGWHNSTPIHLKSYIIGKDVNISEVPPPICNVNSASIGATKLKNHTTTYLRSGYNANTSMTMLFSNIKVYSLRSHGISESKGNIEIFNGGISTSGIIEY